MANRSQSVSINRFDSLKLEIKSGVPQGYTLGTLSLLYINDLSQSLKFSTTSHFADDTSIIYASKTLKTLESNLNYDLKFISEWLKSNRLSLNVDKTKLLIFHSKNNKMQFNDISIKIQNVKIMPSNYVKYLGVLIDENLSWDQHVKDLSCKLSSANGIISKLRHYAPKSAVLSVYHAIFYSHMIYGSSVWSLTTKSNLDLINILQKKSMRIINFAPYNSHTISLFVDNSLLKLDDIITCNKIKLAFDFKNNALPVDHELFKYCHDVHSYPTHTAFKEGFFVPMIKSTTYGINTLRYSVPVVWNKFSNLNNLNSSKHILLHSIKS